MKRSITILAFSAAVLLTPHTLLAQSPPGRPAAGPGSAVYPHASLTTKGPFYANGGGRDDNYLYYVYEPAFPTPASAPVVLFLHGWMANDPAIYGGWIQHLVRKGHVVVWARFDAGLTLPVRFPEKALTTWKDALQRLATQPNFVRPAVVNGVPQTGITGHSVGGYMSALIAALASDPANGAPPPQAVVAVLPGGLNVIKREELTRIDPATKLVVIVGEQDIAVGDEAALEIWKETWQIPNVNRDYLIARSSARGSYELTADHQFPTTSGSRGRIDAMDFYITYKLSVAAFNCAFKGLDCQYALGDGSAEQIDMGNWSDGVPATPLLWVQDPLLTAVASSGTRSR